MDARTADPFFDSAPRQARSTSAGPVELPILYRDSGWFGLFYRVDLGAARTLVAHASVEPWPVLGRAIAAVFVYDYRETSIGPYGELGIGILARRTGSRPSLVTLAQDMGAQETQGFWVVNLPVTTPAACAAGIELWGYPKYVTSLTTRFDAAEASARLGDELELQIRSPRLLTTRGPPTPTFTSADGALMRTVVSVDHRLRWGGGAGSSITLLGGDGPCARTVRALRLPQLGPVAVARCDRFRAILPAGVVQS